MRSSYLDYAMSVIVSRALPDARDGLKPVQRRIIWGMWDGGARAGTAYRKAARIVGDVMGRYHPHGDGPVYEAMVRMAQPFSLRYPLVDGQGNFGSVDGDPPAAQRYTEARMAAFAEELVADIDQDTVDFVPNYDGSHNEPMPLPARIPNLLLNGSSGIAVGMATNIPPHHLGEISAAIKMLLADPAATLDDLLTVVKGPDFPTAAISLVGKDSSEVRAAYGEGHGKVTLQARTQIEETSSRSGGTQIVVTELPYQVNKAKLIERIADLVRERKIEGIADLRDESDRNGMRIVIVLKRDGNAAQVRNLLFKHTQMRSTFSINMMAIVDGAPRRLGLKRALEIHIAHRRDVIRRRSEFQLERARDRAHILEGLLAAIDQLDVVIATIRGAESANAALEVLQGQGELPDRARSLLTAAQRRDGVVNPFEFSELQGRAILDLQLRRLAALERQALQDEYAEVAEKIQYLEDLLANPHKIDVLIGEDIDYLVEKYGDERRTEVVEADVENFSEEDLIAQEDCVITLSIRNYVKRTRLEEYRDQLRGGQGSRGATIRDEDAVMMLIVGDSHDNLLFFTDKGRVYHLRAFDIPDSKKQAKGVFITNLIEMDQGERVTAILPVKSYERAYILLATRLGGIKKTLLKAFEEVRRNGKIAMRLDAGDTLVGARMATDGTSVILASSHGQAIRFDIDDLREASRTSGGVRGMKLPKGGYIVGVETPDDGGELLAITERGFGKRTNVEEYPVQGRGGQGVKTLNITDRTGNVAACKIVTGDQGIMLVSRDGIVLRSRVGSISLLGRNTQGVTVMRVGDGDQVVSIAVFDSGETSSKADAETEAEAAPSTEAEAEPES